MACRYLSSLPLVWRIGDILARHTQPLSRWVALSRLRMEENGLSGSGTSMANGWASLSHLALYCGSCSFSTTMSLYVLPTTWCAIMKRLISILVPDSAGIAISPAQASRISLRLFPARNHDLHCWTDRRPRSEWTHPSSTHPYGFSRRHGPPAEEVRRRRTSTDTWKPKSHPNHPFRRKPIQTWCQRFITRNPRGRSRAAGLEPCSRCTLSRPPQWAVPASSTSHPERRARWALVRTPLLFVLHVRAEHSP